VDSVDAGSPAQTAGVRAGDIVAEVGGSAVEGGDDFEARLRGYPAKAPVGLQIWREGREHKISLTPVEFPPAQADALAWDRLGLRLAQGRVGLAVTGVRPGSQAAAIGIERGDTLVRLNNVLLDSLSTFREGLIAARHSRSVLLVVRREGRNYPVSFRF
jgi:serine protease Do